MRVTSSAWLLILAGTVGLAGCTGSKTMPPAWNAAGKVARLAQPTGPAGQPPVEGPPRVMPTGANKAEPGGIAAGRTFINQPSVYPNPQRQTEGTTTSTRPNASAGQAANPNGHS